VNVRLRATSDGQKSIRVKTSSPVSQRMMAWSGVNGSSSAYWAMASA